MRGESGWSSFADREVQDMVDWLLKFIVYEEIITYGIGRACMMESGQRSRWCA